MALSDAAYTLGSTLAQLGLSEATVQRLLAEKLAASDENRIKSLAAVNDSASSRGMLQSSATLKSRADTGLEYDRTNAGYVSGANDDLAKIAQQRLDAQSAYNSAVAQDKIDQANAQDAIKPGYDPTDPFNWKGIAADMASKGIVNPGGTTDDPYNWKGIAAAQLTAAPVVKKTPTTTVARPKNTATSTPKVAPRPGVVVRF